MPRRNHRCCDSNYLSFSTSRTREGADRRFGDTGDSLSPPCASTHERQDLPGKDGWIPLFNGKDLDGWKPKIKGYDSGDNFGDTFRVEDGILKVAYDQYPKFDNQVRPPVFQDAVFALPPADRVSVRRRPVPGGPELGVPKQRRHDPRPVARQHEKRPGIPGLDRGPVLGRQRQGQATHRQCLHARHEHRDERQAHHPALQ